MREFDLKAAQGGIAAGRAFVLGRGSGEKAGGTKDAETELSRFQDAVDDLEQELSAAAAGSGGDGAAIYEAERMLLRDERFLGETRRLIREEGVSAAEAVRRTGDALAEELAGSDNSYIRQRSEDEKGIASRICGILAGESDQVLREPSILAAEELSPARLAALDEGLLLGIVTAKGGPTSHVAILAGNAGIPYVYGSEDAVAAIDEGCRLILDEGKLIVDPEEEAYLDALRRMEEAKEKRQRESSAARDATRRTKVFANIAGPQQIEELLASGAEGVGLFRSEFLFLDHAGAPSEEEQFDAYRRVAEAMDGKDTVIRTMDLGSDKKADWLDLPEEKNPALGCRGLRVCLREEELFRTQLRALLRAAACGNVKIMVPMIASPWEVDAVRERLEKYAEELAAEGLEHRIPPLGIMVETPAAAVTADRLAEKVDFFSIGTNDLTQYALALDREAEGLDDFYDPCHEAVMRLIGMTAEAGRRRGVPTAVCGEMAGNPDAVGRLIERGVDELSVSVARIAATKACAAEAEERLRRKGRLPDAAAEPLPEETPLAAPADGKLIPMEDIPDPVFSAGTLGECFGILPENSAIYAPCDGVVSGVAETKHAITFTASDGRKILLHAGIDTVKLGGKGLQVFVKTGETVAKGSKVMEADPEVIRAAGLSPMIITVICS